jgi:hypothetical protein
MDKKDSGFSELCQRTWKKIRTNPKIVAGAASIVAGLTAIVLESISGDDEPEERK